MTDAKKYIYKNYLDIAYFIILAAFITHTYFDTTTFSLPWPSQYYEILRIAMVGFVLVKLGLSDISDIKELSVSLLFWLILTLAWKQTGYIFLIEIAFLALGAKDVSFYKIAVLYLVISCSILLMAFLGSILGVIPNLIYYTGKMPKNSYGIIYSTDFGAHLLFTALVYCYVRGRKITYFECLLMAALGLAVFKYCRARMNAGGLLILAGLLAGFKFAGQYSGKDSKRLVVNLKNGIAALMTFSIIIFSLCSVALTKFYNPGNPFWNQLDRWLSGRMELGQRGLTQYGVKLFGTAFDLIGTDYIRKGEYNFIDSSYVLIMLRYGLLTLLIFVALITWAAFRAKKQGEENLIIALCVLAMQCSIEHHFLEINYNIFLLLPFAVMGRPTEVAVKPEATLPEARKKAFLTELLIMVGLAAVVISRQRLISYGRTVVTVFGLYRAERQIYFVLAGILSGGVIAGLVYLFRKYRRYYRQISMLGAGSVLVVLISLFVAVRSSMKYYENDIAQTRERLSDLGNGLSDIPIYVEDVPYYYELMGVKVRPGVPYTKNGKKNIVLTRPEDENIALLWDGYVCGRLNSKEFVYTNEENVVSMLNDAGVKLNPYSDYLYEVDLKKMAEYNHLEMTGDTLVLNGPSQSIYCGPWATVYGGQLKVTCELELIQSSEENPNIATFCATQDNGSREILKYEITKDDFNGENGCVLDLQNRTGTISDLEFKLYLNEGVKIRVNSIKYCKIDA